MTDRAEVVVIGAGQAGLAISNALTHASREHVVLERGRVGETWRGWWDGFCLMSPNWALQLPGYPYAGDDPDGFMGRDEVVRYLERYASRCHAPIRAGVEVTALEPASATGFLLQTSAGPIAARTVVVSTGAFQRPFRPAVAATVGSGLLQVDSGTYRRPAELPDGAVLIVGSGQSGCQIAEELHEAGRDVWLACGRAPWAPRRIGGRDAMWWGVEIGFFEASLSSLPSPAARLVANVQATGVGGGHDLHYRTLQTMGVTLLGRFLGADGQRARFAPDLADSVAWGDQVHAQLMNLIRKVADERGLPAPDVPEPAPFRGEARETLDLRGFGAVVFAGGYRPDYASWVRVPGAFDGLGFPIQNDGASTVVPGLYFAGVPFLRKRKSSLFLGVGEDAAIIAGHIARRHAVPAA